MRRYLPAVLVLALALLPAESFAGGLPTCAEKYGLRDAPLSPGPGKTFSDIEDRAELSGVGYLLDDRLAVISNEAIGDRPGSKVQVFERDGDGFVHLYDRPVFTKSEESKECRADIEGLAVWQGEVFVTPSFAMGRRKPKDKAAFEAGDLHRKCAIQTAVLRLGAIGAEKSVTPERPALDIEEAVQEFGVLKPFLKAAAKENGVDIEGLAVTKDRIYLGLRGPVLDRNLTPVIIAARAEAGADPEASYLDLGGLGIRDLTAVGEDSFLLIAGPVGRMAEPFILYSWNGRDGFPGGGTPNPATPLCKLDSGAEGVAVRPLAEGGHEMIVVFDGDAMKAQTGRLPHPAF